MMVVTPVWKPECSFSHSAMFLDATLKWPEPHHTSATCQGECTWAVPAQDNLILGSVFGHLPEHVLMSGSDCASVRVCFKGAED